MDNVWITEEFMDTRYGYKVKETLFSGKSEFQKVDVVDTVPLGKMLFNDNLVMISERDEFVYHDMITHTPLFMHPNPKNVLVIGGGDGGSLREVLRHKRVEKCTMVEIDAMVVEACKKHIPQTSLALDDARAQVIIDDGLKFVNETKEKFDVIIVDSTDPVGPATPLFGEDFYKDIYRCLSDDGIVVSQAESPFLNAEMQGKILSIMKGIFSGVYMYNYTNLTYPGGIWSFAMGSKKYHPIRDLDEKRVEDSGLEFEYYNAGIHKASFYLPSFQKRAYLDFLSDI